MDRYAHTVMGELFEALTALPDLDAAPAERTRQRATGTFGKAPDGAGAYRNDVDALTTIPICAGAARGSAVGWCRTDGTKNKRP